LAHTSVGALGTVCGVTAAEATEATLAPALLTATTVNVYLVPLTKPSTSHDKLVLVQDLAPGDEVTEYPVIGAPPSEAGADHDTVADSTPATANTPFGAPGTVTS
jgi:hypothetical protein